MRGPRQSRERRRALLGRLGAVDRADSASRLLLLRQQLLLLRLRLMLLKTSVPSARPSARPSDSAKLAKGLPTGPSSFEICLVN